MAAVAVPRWVLTHLVERPAAWVVAICLATALPLLVHLAPLGVVASADHGAAAAELALLASLLAAAASLGVLVAGREFLELLPRHSRLLGEAATLLSAAAAGIGLVLAGSLLLTEPGSAGGLGQPQLLGALVVAASHVAALGFLLLRVPRLTPGIAAVLLLLFAWVVPALAGDRGVGWVLGVLLSPVRYLEDPTSLVTGCLAAAALAALALPMAMERR